MAKVNSPIGRLKGRRKVELKLSEEAMAEVLAEAEANGSPVTDAVLASYGAGRIAKAHAESLVKAARLIVDAHDVLTDIESRQKLNEIASGLLATAEGLCAFDLRANVTRRARRAAKRQ